MFRALPPIKVSSTSTLPANLQMPPSCSARRILCSMNQAVFWVTPRARDNSQELMPFLAFTIIQNAGNHLSSPRGLSSNTVPSFTENCLRQNRHFQRFWLVRNRVDVALHQG